MFNWQRPGADPCELRGGRGPWEMVGGGGQSIAAVATMTWVQEILHDTGAENRKCKLGWKLAHLELTPNRQLLRRILHFAPRRASTSELGSSWTD